MKKIEIKNGKRLISLIARKMRSIGLFAQKVTQEKVMKEASNLTFVTVLGFVPFLLFIVFLLPAISFLNIQEIMQKYIISTFLPESADMIINQVNDLINNTVQMNIFNIIMVVITSYSLFASISGSFDKILRIENVEQRNVITILIKFFGTIIFGFLTIVLLFSMSSLPYFTLLFEQSFIKLLISKLLPMIIWFILIFFIYFFVPSKRLKTGHIAVSSIYSAIAWLLLKNGFDWYILHMTRMQVFYGVIASFPIFLFWIYANWIIVLSGIVYLSTLTNKEVKKKVRVEQTLKIIIEDEHDFYLIEDKPLNPKQSEELVKIIREKMKS